MLSCDSLRASVSPSRTGLHPKASSSSDIIHIWEIWQASQPTY